MAKDKKAFTVRFEPYLLAELKAIAKHERRSINDEVQYIIHSYIRDYNQKNPWAEEEMIDDISFFFDGPPTELPQDDKE